MFWQTTADALIDGAHIDELRNAIQANRISFPVPVPIFATQFRPDIQWRLVELYFIRGWSSKQLADRYGVTSRRIQQSLQHWAGRAMARGYLQEIPPASVLTQPVALEWPVAAIPAVPKAPHFPPIPAIAAPDVAAMHQA